RFQLQVVLVEFYNNFASLKEVPIALDLRFECMDFASQEDEDRNNLFSSSSYFPPICFCSSLQMAFTVLSTASPFVSPLTNGKIR
ncbi:hypothetical protein LINPERHAP1_LOCUS13036, partial [Linum perenne]